MSKILVIGYGNTLRGDDGAGPRVAEMIARRFPQVDSLVLHELQPELAEAVSGYEEVIFVDAHVLQKTLMVKELRGDYVSRPADSYSHSP
ncbi:MAG: hydrogenase maturation protease, partial [Terriglobia bacterium]